MDFQTGDKIKVYDSSQIELGEGTLIKTERIPGMAMTVYECQEHTILAKGTHYVRLGGQLHKIEPQFYR